MRLIDAIPLKQSIAISAILKDGKTLERIIDEQPTIEPEVKFIRLPNENPVDMFPLLSAEEKQQSREYAQGYSDALADMRGEQE